MKANLKNWLWLFVGALALVGGIAQLAPSAVAVITALSLGPITLSMLAGLSIVGLSLMTLGKINYKELL